MPDRHWMEKWKTDPVTGRLTRKRDGTPAKGWLHAAEIEAREKGITRNQLLSDERAQMVKLAELYPSDVELPKRVRTGAPKDPFRSEVCKNVKEIEKAAKLGEAMPPPLIYTGTAARDIAQGETVSNKDFLDNPVPLKEPTWASEIPRRSKMMLWIGWIFFVAALYLVLTSEALTPSGAIAVLMFFAGVAAAGYCLKD